MQSIRLDQDAVEFQPAQQRLQGCAVEQVEEGRIAGCLEQRQILGSAEHLTMPLGETLKILGVATANGGCQPTRRKSSLPTGKGPHCSGVPCRWFRPWAGALAGCGVQRHSDWLGPLVDGCDELRNSYGLAVQVRPSARICASP